MPRLATCNFECPAFSRVPVRKSQTDAQDTRKVSRDSRLLRHHTPKHSQIQSDVNGRPDQSRANQRPKARDFASLEQLAAMRVSVSSILYFLKKVVATTVKRRHMGVPPLPGQKRTVGEES